MVSFAAVLALPDAAHACARTHGSPYAGVFFDNDFSYLDGDCTAQPDTRDGLSRFTDRAKRRALGQNLRLDFGGELRLRAHAESGLALSRLNGADNDFTLSRLRLYANVELGQNVRFFGEFIDARSFGESLGPRGIEEVRTDLLNGFAEFKFPLNNGDWRLRLGRQELLFGAQRLISPLDWGNTRRSFDGARLDFASRNWDVSAFVAAPRQITPEFSSRTDDDTLFSGLYATHRFGDGMLVDGYLLLLDTDPPTGGAGTRWTVGGRHAGTRNGFFWEIEAAHQFGDIARRQISASMVSAGLGYRFTSEPWSPRVALYYDLATGDSNAGDNQNETFNQLFPLGHAYLGFADLVGRQNIEALSLRVTAKPTSKLTLGAALHRFWLHEASDGLYNAGGAIIRQDATGAAGRSVGTELDLTATWQVLQQLDLELGYAQFWGGSFVDRTNPAGVSGDASLLYAQMRLRF